jgi:kynureninase
VRHRSTGTFLGPSEQPLSTSLDLTAAAAAELDARDPLKGLAAEFHHPYDSSGTRLTYLCGHSLGLQHESTKAYVEQELADWRRLAVLGHHSAERPWIPYHESAALGLAPLVGAGATEVVAMNSLTVNLHLMMVSFFRPSGERNRILIEKSAFPSDRYAVASQLEFHGLNAHEHLIEIAPRPGELTLRTQDIAERIEREGARLALVLLPGVQYLSGQLLELAPLVAAARAAGAAVGLDLAHAIGNVPLALHDWNVDFAVWCSYKYLNAGPGAVGGCFVHGRHANRRDLPRFAGWWGHDKAARFEMGPNFDAIPGAEGWQISNPPVLSTAPLLASLAVFERAGIDRVREKSLALTAYMRRLIEARLPGAVDIVTPRGAAEHGSQLSLRLLLPRISAKLWYERLTADGVVGDWREPDTLRLSAAPLYNSFQDVFTAVEALAHAAGPGGIVRARR